MIRPLIYYKKIFIPVRIHQKLTRIVLYLLDNNLVYKILGKHLILKHCSKLISKSL